MIKMSGSSRHYSTISKVSQTFRLTAEGLATQDYPNCCSTVLKKKKKIASKSGVFVLAKFVAMLLPSRKCHSDIILFYFSPCPKLVNLYVYISWSYL